MFTFMLFFSVFFDCISAKTQNPVSSIYIKSKDMDDLLDYSNGALGSENDCLLLLKLYILMAKLSKNDVKLIPNIVQIYQQVSYTFSQYLKKPIEDKLLQLDDLVVFYVVKKSLKNNFIKSPKEAGKVDEGNIKNILKYLNKNARYCEIPLTLFRKKFNKLHVNDLSFIEDGEDLIIVIKKQKHYVHSVREDLVRFFNLFILQDLTLDQIYDVHFSES